MKKIINKVSVSISVSIALILIVLFIFLFSNKNFIKDTAAAGDISCITSPVGTGTRELNECVNSSWVIVSGECCPSGYKVITGTCVPGEVHGYSNGKCYSTTGAEMACTTYPVGAKKTETYCGTANTNYYVATPQKCCLNGYTYNSTQDKCVQSGYTLDSNGYCTSNSSQQYACYLCGGSSQGPGNYVWGLTSTYDSNSSCVKQTSITSSSSCQATKITAIHISGSSDVTVGGTTSLTYTVEPSNATNGQVTWSSSNTSVATVNAGGGVTGVSAGNVTITATAKDGSGVQATKAMRVIAVTYACYLCGGSSQGPGSYVWGKTSTYDSNSSCVKQTSITSESNCKATLITSISITGGSSVAVGSTITLGYTFTPSNATNAQVTWNSSNTSVATVNAGGGVTGVKAGTVTITATAKDGSGIQATKTITVSDHACFICGNSQGAGYVWTTLSASQGSCTLIPEVTSETACLALKNYACYKCTVSQTDIYIWHTENPSSQYCSKDTSAATEATCVGKNPERCFNCNGTRVWTRVPSSISCTIVSSATTKSACTGSGGGGGGGGGGENPEPEEPTGVTVKPTKWLLGIGEQKTLYPTVTPSNASQSVSYSSSNTSAAIVDSNGMMTGVEVGEATMTVTTTEGNKTATSEITVVGSSTTKQIMTTRIDDSLTKLVDATESDIHKEQGIEKNSDGTLIYPFGLGCELGEHYCFDSVEYQNQVTSITADGDSKTIDDIKNEWNNDTVNPNRWDKNGMNDGTATLATDDIKGSYYAIYKHAGKYEGKNIDVKVTIVDFEPMQDERYLISTPAIVITNKEMGVAVTGIKWVKVKYEFLNSDDNSEKITLKGNTTYWDVDQNQGVVINSDNTNKGIFFVNGGIKTDTDSGDTVENVENQLYYKYITDGLYIFDHNSGVDQSKTNPIYSDNLNSTAYAFTEEFEGSEIVRTFQYSNPIFKNTANERVWNGHGAVYVSSTPISTSNQYAIITEVENGDISPSVAVFEGDSATITYSPDQGYSLSYIEIDGVKQNLKGITTSYTFKNVTKDHIIKVVYSKGGSSNPSTGLFEVGGILLAVAGIGTGVYFYTRKKRISNV